MQPASVEVQVVVIGAGPSGLAAAACLKQRGIDSLIVEQAEQVGHTWRRHYDRLHLHTAKKHSALPFRPFPADTPLYPSRDQVIEYLEDYAAAFELQPRFGTQVTDAAPTSTGWRLHTSKGGIEAANLVIAAGYNRVPLRPELEGLTEFEGKVLHSSEYRTGRDFQGERVLVVGCGNSGAEIALDLAEQGAQPTLVVRSPIHVTPREVFGTPTQVTNIRLSRLPVALADFIALRTLPLLVGDLSAYGIERPSIGPNAQILKHGRIPLIDVGTIEAIKAGRIRVSPGIVRFSSTQVHFQDGEAQAFDTVVLATGYTTGLASFLHNASDILDPRGRPPAFGEETLPGLYFVGYRNPPTGALREAGIEAKRVAGLIAGKVAP